MTMFNINNFLRSVLLAIVMAGTAGAAFATPYHVTINTAAYASAGTGILDFTFTSNGASSPAFATISNFSGAIGGIDGSLGGVSGALPGTTTLSNAISFTELSQIVTFGSVFSFDIDFGGAYASVAGDNSLFGIALYDSSYSTAFGVADPSVNPNLIQFSLAAMSVAGVLGGVTPALLGTGATATAIAAVPEPADWLLMLTGLAFVVYMTRLNGRTNARRLAVA
jgi:hypothetical protein